MSCRDGCVYFSFKFALLKDDKLFEERKRAKSLTEPISIFTNAFLPQSSSPSPSRSGVEVQKVSKERREVLPDLIRDQLA